MVEVMTGNRRRGLALVVYCHLPRQQHRQMRHRLTGRCAMPVPLPWRDQHDITRCDVELFGLIRHDALAVSDNQDLLGLMRVPAVPGTVLERKGGDSQRRRILISHQVLAEDVTNKNLTILPFGLRSVLAIPLHA